MEIRKLRSCRLELSELEMSMVEASTVVKATQGGRKIKVLRIEEMTAVRSCLWKAEVSRCGGGWQSQALQGGKVGPTQSPAQQRQGKSSWEGREMASESSGDIPETELRELSKQKRSRQHLCRKKRSQRLSHLG